MSNLIQIYFTVFEPTTKVIFAGETQDIKTAVVESGEKIDASCRFPQ